VPQKKRYNGLGRKFYLTTGHQRQPTTSTWQRVTNDNPQQAITPDNGSPTTTHNKLLHLTTSHQRQPTTSYYTWQRVTDDNPLQAITPDNGSPTTTHNKLLLIRSCCMLSVSCLWRGILQTQRTHREKISIFPWWTFHFYLATFQQHLHVEYISLSWSDIPELGDSIMISLIEDCC
jgi:hypothetical protein